MKPWLGGGVTKGKRGGVFFKKQKLCVVDKCKGVQNSREPLGRTLGLLHCVRHLDSPVVQSVHHMVWLGVQGF